MTAASMARKYEPRKPPAKDKDGNSLTTSAMIASLAAEGYDTVAAPFGNALVDLASRRDDIVGLTADLAKYTDLHVFAKAYPDRFYQMGMAEQVMISAAAGLAREGFVPFATTYAVFASRRAYDFICMAIAEENLPVKIVCALPGSDHRLRSQPPGDRGPGDLPRPAEPDHHRPVRRRRHHTDGAGHDRPSRACVCPAVARKGAKRADAAQAGLSVPAR